MCLADGRPIAFASLRTFFVDYFVVQIKYATKGLVALELLLVKNLSNLPWLVRKPKSLHYNLVFYDSEEFPVTCPMRNLSELIQ